MWHRLGGSRFPVAAGWLAAALFLLAGCGGGGGGGSGDGNGADGSGDGGGGGTTAPASPSLSVQSFSTKQVQLGWSTVSGAETYRLEYDADGSGSYVQVGADLDSAATAVSATLPVHLTDWANAQFRLLACNSAGCSESSPVGISAGMLEAIGYFKASNAEALDKLGHSVALSADGATLAVGAQGEDSATTGINTTPNDDGTADQSGAAYVFVRDAAGAWSEQAYIKASNTGDSDGFGWPVALSADGNTLAVGARLEDSATTGINTTPNDDSTANNSGAVYVFTRDGNGTWSEQAYIKASNTGAGDWFGFTLALSGDGDTLAVGANFEDSATTGIDSTPNDDGTADDSGAVYVFTRDGTGAWSEQSYLKASNAEADDRLGTSVALSGNGDTLAAGAYFEDSVTTGVNTTPNDDGTADQSGATYVFVRDGTGTWSEQAYIKPSNTGAGDLFGFSASLSESGDTLAVGGYHESSATTGINTTPNDDGTADLSGATYVFVRDGTGTWSEQAYIKPSNTGDRDWFGFSVALTANGDILAVGAKQEDGAATGINGTPDDNATFSGAAYVFIRDGTGTWGERAYVKAAHTEASDEFGWSVDLSGNGKTLAVAVPLDDSATTGINTTPNDDGTGDHSGAVYVY